MNRPITLLILLTIGVLSSMTVLACETIYTPGNNITIIDQIIPEGEGSECNLSITNGTDSIQNGTMNVSGLAYRYDAGQLANGDYNAGIVCTNGSNVYYGQCNFSIKMEDNTMLAIIVLLPLLLGIIMLVGAVSLNAEEHKAMKIFLFLFSMIPFFVSLHWGVLSLIKFYNFPELQDAVGDVVYWFGLIFLVIISYFVIYMIWKGFESAAQKRKARLEY